MRKLALATLLLLPVPAAALGLGPPLAVPATPGAPVLPPGDAPPVLELDLPAPPEPSGPPADPVGMPELPMASPELPPQAYGGGVPDLTAVVLLPGAASGVADLAPPFGAPLPARAPRAAVVPEPSTAILLVAGLVGLGAPRASAARRRRTIRA